MSRVRIDNTRGAGALARSLSHCSGLVNPGREASGAVTAPSSQRDRVHCQELGGTGDLA